MLEAKRVIFGLAAIAGLGGAIPSARAALPDDGHGVSLLPDLAGQAPTNSQAAGDAPVKVPAAFMRSFATWYASRRCRLAASFMARNHGSVTRLSSAACGAGLPASAGQALGVFRILRPSAATSPSPLAAMNRKRKQ